MESKEQKKAWRRKIAWCFGSVFLFLAGNIPLAISHVIGAVLGWLAYYLIARHRKVSLESLAIAFPDMPLAQRKKITKKYLISLAQGVFKVIYYHRHEQKLLNTVSFKGKEYIPHSENQIL